MNQEINYLKKYNWEEKLGFFLINRGLNVLGWVLGTLFFGVATFYVVQYFNQKKADHFIEEANGTVTQTINQIIDQQNFVNTQSYYFHEKAKYQQLLDNQYQLYTERKNELTILQTEKAKDIIQKFKEGLITRFKPDATCEGLMLEIQDIYNSQNQLVESWSQMNHHYEAAQKSWKSETEKQDKIQENTPYTRVQNTSKKKFTQLETSLSDFREIKNKNTPFNKSDIGKYNYSQITKLVKIMEKITRKYDQYLSDLGDFTQYYKLLIEQHYSTVKEHHSNPNLAYESEPNPAFREWQETETYTDTETYYESENYSSTCTETSYETTTTIMDGRAVTRRVPVSRSVPCTKTRRVSKTRPVTRTRSVTRNNGEPRYVDVPYTTFTFYYTVELIDPSGKKQESLSSGKVKIQGTNPSTPGYNFGQEEQIGYVVWKEKWNDQEQKGFLKPYLK